MPSLGSQWVSFKLKVLLPSCCLCFVWPPPWHLHKEPAQAHVTPHKGSDSVVFSQLDQGLLERTGLGWMFSPEGLGWFQKCLILLCSGFWTNAGFVRFFRGLESQTSSSSDSDHSFSGEVITHLPPKSPLPTAKTFGGVGEDVKIYSSWNSCQCQYQSQLFLVLLETLRFNHSSCCRK